MLSDKREQYRKNMRQLFRDLDYSAGLGFKTTEQWLETQEIIHKKMDLLVLEWADVIK